MVRIVSLLALGVTIAVAVQPSASAQAPASAQPSTSAEPAPGTEVRFVACPIYRDTDNGRKSGCWLGDDASSGLRFDIGQGIAKPQLDREVLVEGVVAAQDHACGAVVLKPVRTSTLQSSCPGALLPAEGFPGRRAVATRDVFQPAWIPRQLPPPPYAPQVITVLFDFGSDFLNYQYSENLLERAALYARASHARSVRVEGFAATRALTVSGRELKEPLPLANERAAMVAEALRRLQVDAASIHIVARAVTQPAAALATTPEHALAEAAQRRVEIHIDP
jgi:outer membrane protein OmpA-like peptidoglycan-associated protein